MASLDKTGKTWHTEPSCHVSTICQGCVVAFSVYSKCATCLIHPVSAIHIPCVASYSYLNLWPLVYSRSGIRSIVPPLYCLTLRWKAEKKKGFRKLLQFFYPEKYSNSFQFVFSSQNIISCSAVLIKLSTKDQEICQEIQSH